MRAEKEIRCYFTATEIQLHAPGRWLHVLGLLGKVLAAGGLQGWLL